MKSEVAPIQSNSRRWRPQRPVPFLLRHLAQCKPNRLSDSMRIPVTPANRSRLRAMRAAEMAAWEMAVPLNCLRVVEA
jgi:hypothetical protein